MLKNSNYNNTKKTEINRSKRSTLVHPKLPGVGGGGYSLTRGHWGCAAGWGRIFTTGLTIIELHFH